MATIPGLDSASELLDTDVVMITHANGTTEKLSGAEFNREPQKLATLFNDSVGAGTSYFKINGLYAINSENVYTLQAREGELYIISTGYLDNGYSSPNIEKVFSKYGKIMGFSYLNNGSLIIKVGQYSHRVILTQIAGNVAPEITVEETTETEYNQGTLLTCKNDISDVITLINDTDAEVYARTCGNIAILSCHAKQAVNEKSVNISSLDIQTFGFGYKAGLFWGANAFRGEMYISNSSTMYISSSGEGNGSLVAFKSSPF